MEKKINCPICKIEMKKIRDVQNPYHPDCFSHGEFKCSGCNKMWNYNGSEMWNNDPPRKVRFKKKPEIGDKYTDVIEPI